MLEFYVYVLFRHDTGAPFYVGKGQKRRYVETICPAYNRKNIQKLRIIARARKAKASIPLVVVARHLTEPQAFEIERAWITAIGRKPCGPLVNLTNGGEGHAGLKRPEQAKVMQRLHADPAFKARHSKRQTDRWNELRGNPEWEAKNVARTTALFKSEAFRKAASERMKARHASTDPKERAKLPKYLQ